MPGHANIKFDECCFLEIRACCFEVGTEDLNNLCVQKDEFLGARAKFSKATFRVVMTLGQSVLSSAWNNSAPTGGFS